ncbi:CapA family protein [Paenibacillus sacheonensis]|uniref:CapA family protein n=1 Tax=Paenibacillus sacheonensis TaxID=742054 RepID=A0A7X5BV27_9BACL|nr:CapA family protein [Paenibacillus sacheonensis]MBM7563463.1 poly-gamma-glutamate synthesis protein (capsule biosynthesis protein) [Paenibacillus sacheonensis]NBC67983.1 CapA family protein [Paenibacillus sacheonensis]
MKHRSAKRLTRRWLPILLCLLLIGGCSSGPKLAPVPPDQAADNSNGHESPPPSQEPAPDSDPGNTPDNGSQLPDEPAGNSGSEDAPGADEDVPNAGGDSAQPPVDDGTYDATWVAAGDIMMHMPQLPGAYDEAAGTYNFNSFFKPVKPILEQGDWTLGNLETPIAGKSLGLSGYPRFNAPAELGDALKYAGFTTITNANNHAMDRGSQGIAMTLAKLQKLGLDTKGTARSKAEADKLTIVKRAGISMGLLAYTYGTNGIPLPKDQPYAVSLIDEQAIIKDIGRLKAAGADFITVCLHFGIEYQTTPNDEQTMLARNLIAAGADIIAGSHPHVVQPYELAEVTNPDGTARKGLIIYSMGNFISNQRGNTKDYGVIYKVGIHKEHGATTIGSVKAIPTWVHRTSVKGVNRYAIVPIGDAIASKSLADLSSADYAAVKSTYAQVTKRIESMHSKPVQLQASQ